MPANHREQKSSESLDARAKGRRRGKPTFTLGHFVLLVVAGGAAMLVMTNSWGEFVKYLYNPFSVLILVVIAGMYIFQESADRSRMYRLELREMRRNRVEDLQFYRRIQEELESLNSRIRELESAEIAGPTRQNLMAARKDLEDSLDRMRERTG